MPVQVPVAVRFAARVGAQPFRCGAGYDGIGRTASRITPSDFRFYVSSVALLDEDGRAVPLHMSRTAAGSTATWPCSTSRTAAVPAATATPACTRPSPGARAGGPLPRPAVHAGRAGRPQPRRPCRGATTAEPERDVLELAGRLQVRQDRHGHARPGTGGTARRRAAPAWPARRAPLPIHLGSTDCVSPAATAAPSSCARPTASRCACRRLRRSHRAGRFDLAALLRDTDVDVNAPDSAPGCMAGPDDADCRFVMPAFGLPSTASRRCRSASSAPRRAAEPCRCDACAPAWPWRPRWWSRWPADQAAARGHLRRHLRRHPARRLPLGCPTGCPVRWYRPTIRCRPPRPNWDATCSTTSACRPTAASPARAATCRRAPSPTAASCRLACTAHPACAMR